MSENYNSETFQSLIKETEGKYYVNLPEKIKADKNILIKAIMAHPLSFKFSSELFKDDADIAKIAMLQSNSEDIFQVQKIPLHCFNELSERLKQDKNFILEILYADKDASMLQFLEPYRSDKDIILSLVKSGKPNALYYASDYLYNNDEFRETCFSLNAECINFVNASWLRKNIPAVKVAIKNNPKKTLQMIEDNRLIKTNFELWLETFNQNAIVLDEYLDEPMFKSFVNQMHSYKDEFLYIVALDKINRPDDSPDMDSPANYWNHRMIDFILSHISQPVLQTLQFKSKIIENRALIAIENKKISNTEFKGNKKKVNRKTF